MKAALVAGQRKPFKLAAAVTGIIRKLGSSSGSLKHFFAACLVLSLGIILAYHFFLFWTAGRVIIEEPNKAILCLESMLSLGIIAFGLERLIRS